MKERERKSLKDKYRKGGGGEKRGRKERRE